MTTTAHGVAQAQHDTSARRVHTDAIAAFDRAMPRIRDDQWSLPTPCADWDVRALVGHVVGEARWTAPLLAGRTIAEVGDALDGDLLGDDPLTAWRAARDEATDAADRTPIDERIVHLSFGDTPAAEYLRQLTADYLVHAWDLAVAVGADARLEPHVITAVADWFAPLAAVYRSAGAITAPTPTTPEDSPQRRLLAEFGRDSRQCESFAAVARFDAAFDRQDIDAVMAAMTDDCVFESTAPPDGARYEGQAAVRKAWQEFFASTGAASFETEERIACGDRVVTRWCYRWTGGHVRGVDVFRIRDGLVAEKYSYVKG